jgi:hypothetical protein
MTTKTESLINQYEQTETMSAADSQSRHGRRTERIDTRNKRLMAVAGLGIAALIGVSQVQYDRSMPPMRTITETVQPKDYQNPSLVAGRAEQELGHDAADFNLQAEALRIAGKYGQLYTGERIQVEVR